MNINLSDEDIKFLKTALNYTALSLDGNALDNSKLDDKSKLNVMGRCFYLMQMLDNPVEDKHKDSVADG